MKIKSNVIDADGPDQNTGDLYIKCRERGGHDEDMWPTCN